MARDLPQAAGFTALVHFHGMGSQRRYEEITRMIERLADWPGLAAQGLRLGPVTPETEPQLPLPALGIYPQPGASVVALRADLLDDSGQIRHRYRFYEAYWAPVLADEAGFGDVLGWCLGQALRPWRNRARGWHELQRLRRAALETLLESRPQDRPLAQDLIARYRDFCRQSRAGGAVGAAQAGLGGDFSRFLAGLGPDPALRALALAWRRRHRRDEWRNSALLAALALGLLLMLALVGLAGLSLAALGLGLLLPELSQRLGLAGGLAGGLPLPLLLSVGLGLAGGILALSGATRFFRAKLGDVQAWTTYEETASKHQKRREILALGRALLAHLRASPDCARLVVTGHSLGSSVAYDCLLAQRRASLAAAMQARQGAPDPARARAGFEGLAPIDHLLTYGSPIDKINYFFESDPTSSALHGETMASLRGDLGAEPFTSPDGQARIRWINLWNRFDPFSAPLQTPLPRFDLGRGLENLEVTPARPQGLAKAHNGYIETDSLRDLLAEAVFGPDLALPPSPLQPGPGAGRFRGYLGFLLGALVLVPGAALAGLWAWLG